MNDPVKKVAYSRDYACIAANGAYINVEEGETTIIFYRDLKCPLHTDTNEIQLVENNRELLHEVRMSVDNARKLSSELEDGIFSYDREISEREGWAKIERDLEVVRDKLAMDAEKVARSVTTKIVDVVQATDFNKRRELVALFDKILEENRDRINDFVAKYPSAVEVK